MTIHNRLRNMTIRRLAATGRGACGVPVTLKRFIPGVFDPKTGSMTGDAVVDYPGSGLRVNYTDRAYNNVDIVYGDFQIYLSPVQSIDPVQEMPAPIVDDTVLFNGSEVKIVRVSPFNENTVGCGWKLQVRYG